MLARFPRSHLTSKSFVKSWMCSYERAGWLGCRDLGFSSRDLGKRAGNAAISTVQPFTGMSSSNEFCIVLLCRCIFFIISIPFDNSDTAFRVSKAVTGAKVITLCFTMFALFPEFRTTTRLRPSHLGNQAEISHMNPR